MNRVEQDLASEEASRELMESSREGDWTGQSVIKELFLGRFRYDWVTPFPQLEPRAEFEAFLAKLKAFFDSEVDADAIDATGEYPAEVLDGLRSLGAFGMKIPTEYGGLGFSQQEYGRAMELMGSYDANLVALLSAHQSIGVPQPVKLFGTEDQKQRFLPRCARGAITAFALTEPDVGSDPARLQSTAVLSDDGTHYVLNGTKLWTTNGTIAELMVVMARHPDSGKISAFVVEADSEGVDVLARCRFMGLRALANGLIAFKDVRVPVENRLGDEGHGLRIAFTTLNAGRLSIPSAVTGGCRVALADVREFARDRVQWGVPVGKHEAVAHMLTDVAATTFTLESVARLSTGLADRNNYDIRLEAAAAKEWCTTRHWDLIDTAIQIKGGRGYETAPSLHDRGDTGTALERQMRDARINRIFEGSSEIMHLFMAREALDKHLEVAGDFVKPKSTLRQKLAALPKMLAFYSWWYPSLWRFTFTRFRGMPLGNHLRFAERSARRLARAVFHGMVRHQARLERKQAFLFRAVEIAIELYAMSAAISRAQTMKEAGDPGAAEAIELADVFCAGARRRIKGWFRHMWANDDDLRTKVGKAVIDGRYSFAEQG